MMPPLAFGTLQFGGDGVPPPDIDSGTYLEHDSATFKIYFYKL